MDYIPYGRQALDREDVKEVVGVLRSDWITQGPKIKEFESALCKYTGAKYAVAVSSGTAALHIASLAADIGVGDEAITSPITFVASANCILYCGGRPVFADIQGDSININPEEIRKKINRRTKAIIPVHFAGYPCNLEEIRDIAREYNLVVIEDAAHALGAEYKGSKIGSCKYSDMAIFSFHPLKAITTGEGGAVLTNKKGLYDKLILLRNHGITKEEARFQIQDPRITGPWYYEMQDLGFNYRITDFQCALGVSQLIKLNKFLKKRRELAQVYNAAFKGLGWISIFEEGKNISPAFHLYVVLLDFKKIKKSRREVVEHLRGKGISTQVHYLPVYRHPYYRKHFDYKASDYPIAEKYYQGALTLPLFPGMSREQLNYVVKKVLALAN